MQKNGHGGTGTTDLEVLGLGVLDLEVADPRETWDKEHKRYLASGVWRCSLSPTGAHHWVGDEVSLTCKHCEKITNAPVGMPLCVVETLHQRKRAALMKRLLVEQFI